MEFKDYAFNYSIIRGCKKQKQNHQLHITEHMLTICGVPQGVINSSLLFFYIHEWSVPNQQLSIKTYTLCRYLVLLLHNQMFTTFKTAWIISFVTGLKNWLKACNIHAEKTQNTLAVNLHLACSTAITSFMKISKTSSVNLFPLHHVISYNFLEKFSDTKMYIHCDCVHVSSLFHLKVTYI